MSIIRQKKYPWYWFIFLSLAISVSASEEDEHFLDASLEEILSIPLDTNAVNIQESHIHKEGEWMVGYRYMYMGMAGNLYGENSISQRDILKKYAMTPLSMDMEMHMGSLMYAPSDDVTLMAMLPYKFNDMNIVTRMGQRFSTHSEGLGDLKLMINGVAFRTRWDEHLISLKGGISIPTGSINQRGDTPMGKNQRLPYPMQLGSGTVDFLPGISYQGLSRDWSWGAQMIGTIRTGKNDNQYRLGDRLDGSAWLSRIWDSWFSTSIRMKGMWWGDIHGADPQLMATMSPTADPQIRGGKRIDMLLSVELYAPDGTLKGQHLGFEIGLPVYQSLDGPQLETDWVISGGWQWTF
ncbi:transporter [methane-oxidizing endosymbiont of Gigantopelta aegis]|uniref:transporter n=1 Tax=methane-oxidizing endosymbiont of Gigantopelta aegis TaxID=2794938 RepID=UPI0018DB5299|nr:transporter [methane-oxidizing endosymbiont of Gigantopelta aegis]